MSTEKQRGTVDHNLGAPPTLPVDLGVDLSCVAGSARRCPGMVSGSGLQGSVATNLTE